MRAEVRRLAEAQLLPEEGSHPHACRVTGQIKFFVWRMRIVVRQCQAQQQGVGVKMFPELVHDGNGTALANQDRLVAEGGLERPHRRLRLLAFGRDEIRFATVTGLDLQAHRRWTEPFEVSAHEGTDFSRFLVRHEAKGQLGPCPGRDDGLGSLALVAAGQAVDFDGGASAASFGGRVAALAEQRGHTEEFSHGRVALRESRQLPSLEAESGATSS